MWEPSPPLQIVLAGRNPRRPVVPPYRERILLPPLTIPQDNFLTNFLHLSDN